MSDLFAVLPGLLVPVVMIGVVIAMVVISKRQRAQVQKDTADYQAGAIAQKLGMRVERGHPHTNLFVPGRTALEEQSYDVLLRGQRGGVPTEIVYHREVTQEAGFASVTVHRSWEGRLTALTNANFGHFEVMLRNPQAWNRTRSFFQNPMPELPTGNPSVDTILRLTGDNPAIAGALGGLLAPLVSLNYVHVIGAPGQVTFLMSHSDAGRGNEMIGVGYALYDAAKIMDVLTQIVRTAEGRA